MPTSNLPTLKQIFTIRWNPNRDLIVVAISWLLVVGALSTATFVLGQAVWGGIAYFLMYAVVGAALCGIGLPLLWMAGVRKRPLSDLGITTRQWKLSLAIQILLTLVINLPRLLQLEFPPFGQLLSLATMALAIGLFEAIFWRGWVQLRLEEAFGILPSILLASLLYAVYHIGYGMPASEITFLFFIGLMFAVVFRITSSILILWPFFQPMGQLITLINDKLALPPVAALGFVEAFAVMIVLIWLANKFLKNLSKKQSVPNAAESHS